MTISFTEMSPKMTPKTKNNTTTPRNKVIDNEALLAASLVEVSTFFKIPIIPIAPSKIVRK